RVAWSGRSIGGRIARGAREDERRLPAGRRPAELLTPPPPGRGRARPPRAPPRPACAHASAPEPGEVPGAGRDPPGRGPTQPPRPPSPPPPRPGPSPALPCLPPAVVAQAQRRGTR